MAAGAKAPPPLAGPSPAVALAFDRAGSRLAVAWGTAWAADDHTHRVDRVVVYDVASGSALRTIRGPFEQPNWKVPLALAPDGSAVAAMGPDHEVASGKSQGTTARDLGRHLAQVLAMAFSPDGARWRPPVGPPTRS